MKKEEKFYNKTWFMYLMLVFLAPIGLIFLWRNKEIKKKTKQILTAIFSVWFIVVIILGQPTEEEIEAEKAKEEQREKEKEEKEEQKAKEKEKKEMAEAEEKERKENRTTIERIEEDSPHVDEVTMDGTELVLVHNPGTVWSENSLMNLVYDMFKEFEEGFSDDEVESIMAIIETEMTDSKGNESLREVITYRYTREAFEELSYDNFLNMAIGEEWRILNESDGYFIHAGIRKNLKDKYIDNLR